MLNFKQFKDNRTVHLGSIEREHRERFLNGYQYIEDLSVTTSTDISYWDLGLFVKPHTNKDYWWCFDDDKKRLTKTFFQERQAREKEDVARSVAPELAEELNTQAKALMSNLISTAKSARAEHQIEAQRAMNLVDNHLFEARKMTGKIMALEGKNVDLAAQVNEIQRQGFFVYERFLTGNLYFKTKTEVILRHTNDDAGVNLRVNVGHFRPVFNIRTSQIKVTVAGGNIEAEGFYHPHLDGSGKVCWGNAQNAATKAASELNLPRLFQLLHGVLTTYNDDNPYVGLSEFQEQAPSDAPPGWETGGRTCGVCDEREDECNCNHCEACDVRYAGGDACPGFFCEECGECTGNERCREHWCRFCGTYDRESCDCCRDCEQRSCECERCPDCDQRRTFDCVATLCRECSRHIDGCQCEQGPRIEAPSPAVTRLVDGVSSLTIDSMRNAVEALDRSVFRPSQTFRYWLPVPEPTETTSSPTGTTVTAVMVDEAGEDVPI